MTTRPRLALLALVTLAIASGCSGGDTRRSSSALVPTAASPIPTSTFADPATARIGALAVSLPSPDDALLFRQVLEAKLQAEGRPLQTTHVNPEGVIVWTFEYLRYRTNGCSQTEAIARVFAQIDRQGVPPVCGTVTGTPEFPPQSDSMAFRQALEVKYRDLGAPPLQTYIDLRSEIVYTLEFVRYSLSGCSSAQSYELVFVQIDGRGVEPDCSAQTRPPPCSYSLSPTPQSVPVAGGSFTGTVTAQPDTCRWQMSADAPWVTGAARAAIGTQGFTYTVAANEGQSRSARITLRGDDEGRATLEISQAGSTAPLPQPPQPPTPPTPPSPPQPPIPPPTPPACTYVISESVANFPAEGGTLLVQVETGPGCAWTARSTTDFVVASDNAAGVGNGTARFSVLRNIRAARSGTVTVSWATGSQAITVNQPTAALKAVIIPPPGGCEANDPLVPCFFDGSQSEGLISGFFWDFGDDSGVGTTEKVSHSYQRSFLDGQPEEVAIVTLTVIGVGGGQSTTQVAVRVRDGGGGGGGSARRLDGKAPGGRYSTSWPTVSSSSPLSAWLPASTPTVAAFFRRGRMS